MFLSALWGNADEPPDLHKADASLDDKPSNEAAGHVQQLSGF
jgi:hypothetical protein